MKLDPKTGQQKICYCLHSSLGDYLAWEGDKHTGRWYCTPDSLAHSADAPYPPLQWREFVNLQYIVTEYNPSIKIVVKRKGE